MTGDIEFDTPSSGDRFQMKEHLGELVVVAVEGVEEGVETDFGAADVIVATVTVVDGPNAGEVYESTWLFGRKLFGQLKRKTGRTLLGRVAQGEAKRGQDAPWQLDPASEAETRTAVEFMRGRRQAEAAATDPETGPAATDLGDTPPWAR